MPRMLVTLDVSRLSAWLNDDAPCRVERDIYKERRDASREAAERAVAVAQAACMQSFHWLGRRAWSAPKTCRTWL